MKIYQYKIDEGAPSERSEGDGRHFHWLTGGLEIPLGCVAASGLKENEDCCYATQWFTKNEDCCYATQWDKKKKIVATQPNGRLYVKYIRRIIVATQPTRENVVNSENASLCLFIFYLLS